MTDSWEPFSPPPINEYRPEYLPAYLSNGLVGLRVGRIPLLDGLCVVEGLVELDPVEDGEGFARGPFPVAGDVEIDGYRLSAHVDRAWFQEQTYDFSCGELSTRFEFRPRDVAARVQVLVFCSRSLPTLVLHEVRVEVDSYCDLVIGSGLSPAGLRGRWRSRATSTPGSERSSVDGLMEWETRGGLSSCGAAYITEFAGAVDVERRIEDVDQEAPLQTRYSVQARPGGRYVVRQVSSLISSRTHHEPDRQAARMAFEGHSRGFDALREENQVAWRDIWKGRIRLIGADRRWQAMADAAFYYLHASAHRTSLFSTSMFGLAYWPNYHYYHGHVMWDIETFAAPVFTLSCPEVARALLSYRLDRVVAARRNAAMNGYAGLQFPWASSPVHGEEVIRLSAPDLILEQHVSLSVAHAFAQYAHATGDPEILRGEAWPVLRGVADWVVSRAVETDRGFEIRRTVGIAEQTEPVDNNAYVNMVATVVLREAATAARRLDLPGAARWEEVARRMFIPVDPASRVIQNHEGYVHRDADLTSATPEALAGLFLFNYEADPGVERATLRFYLDRVGPYVGRPMLSALLGTWAARLQDRELSARLFEEGYAEFVEEPFLVTNEFSPRQPGHPRAGPLVANVGGFLIGCLYGLPGLVLGPGDPADWCRRPVLMPSLWDGVEVDRIWVRGRPACLMARHGEKSAVIEPA